LKFCRFDRVTLVEDAAQQDDSDETVDLALAQPVAETIRDIDRGLTAQTLSPSIAVLPFVNMSNDQHNEYFCDGLAEELLNALAQLDGLKVAARTSSFHFRNKDTTVDQIGKTLNVNTVLEGSVRKLGDRIRVTAQLINVSDGYHLWSARYDRRLEDVFEIQDQITLTIVDALRLKLFGSTSTSRLKRQTANNEAYVAYLKGRYYVGKFSVEGWSRALEYFDEANRCDSDYAPAYAGAAFAWSARWYYALQPPNDIVPKWKALANRALELDGDLSEAHASLGNIQLFYEWDWRAAERSFQKAIEQNQNNADARWFYGMGLASRGRYDEAISQGQRALELDPLSPLVNVQVGWIFWLADRMDDVIAHAKKILDLEPNSFGAYWLIGGAYLAKQMADEAIESYQKSVSLGGSNIVLSALGRAYGIVGKKDDALRILAQVLEVRKSRYIPAFDIARIYLGLGDVERTFEWLEKAFEERNGELVFLERLTRVDRGLATDKRIREDSRLSEMLKRVVNP